MLASWANMLGSTLAIGYYTAAFERYNIADPKWQNIVDFNNIAIKPPYAALKPTLLPSFQYITVHQIQLLGLCGSVIHTERNNTAYCGKLAVSKVQTIIGLRGKLKSGNNVKVCHYSAFCQGQGHKYLPAEYGVFKCNSSTMKRVAPLPLDDDQPISFSPYMMP